MTMRAALLTIILAASLAAGAQDQVRRPSLQEYDRLKQEGGLSPTANYSLDASTPTDKQKQLAAGQLKGGGGNPCDCWIAPDATYTLAMAPNDDLSSAQINLPFSYNLYGALFSSLYINNNGNVSFGSSWGTFSSSAFPDPNYVMVAPFWADVDTRGIGQVWYKITPTAIYINWVDVGYYSMMTDKINNFQLILTDGTDPVIGIGKNTSFCYLDMQWTTGAASGGVNGFGGTPATVGANRGNGIDYIQFGRFDQAGTAYDGPFGANDGVSWLDNQHFEFTTEVFTSNIPPIGSGTGLCDTLTICVGESVDIDFNFLSPEPNQTVTIVTSSTMAGYNVTLNQPGNTAALQATVTPGVGDVGYQTITIDASDDGNPDPPLTSTYIITIEVLMGATMEPGSATVCDEGPPLDLYSLLGGSPLPGGDWTDPNGIANNGTFLPGEDPVGPYVYSLGVGTACPSTGVVTIATVAHADAGDDGTLAKCSSEPAAPLFPQLLGTPQAGGTWFNPQWAQHNGTLQPGSDLAGDYAYVVYGDTPCPNDTAIIAVAIPQAVDPGEDGTITLCTDAVPLFMRDALNGTPDATGSWAAPGGGAFGDYFTAATDVPGIYVYTVPAVLPCPTLSASLTIAVDPLPVAGDDETFAICADGPVTNLFNLIGGGPDAGGIWIDPLDSAHTGTLDPALEISGPYTYVVTGPGTCDHLTDTAIVLVDVNPLPVVLFTVEPDSGCHPLNVTFTNTTDPMYLGNSCIWDLGDGTMGLNECGVFEHLYEEPGWYNVNLTITTPEGCTDHLIVPGAVLVEPAPQAVFDWTPDIGTEYNSNLFFSALDQHAVQFDWTIEEEPASTERQFYHFFQHETSGTYEVCLTVVDRYGCTDSQCDTVQVIVPIIYVPNAFTPDGDGVNEVFLPVLQDMVTADHELLIFDRWGELIFDSTAPHQGWDGRHMNGGEILPQGVYTWRLIGRPADTSDKRDWFGTITLLK